MFTVFLAWLSQPQTIAAIATFLLSALCSVPSIIKMYKESKETTVWNKMLEVAKINAIKAVQNGFKGEEATKFVIDAIYMVLPEKEKQYLPKQTALELSNMAYSTYVKPQLDKIKSEAIKE